MLMREALEASRGASLAKGVPPGWQILGNVIAGLLLSTWSYPPEVVIGSSWRVTREEDSLERNLRGENAVQNVNRPLCSRSRLHWTEK